MPRLLRQRPLRLPRQPSRIFLLIRSHRQQQPRITCAKTVRGYDRECVQPTLVIFFCCTRFFFFGAMVRWPFFGPRAEGLREDDEEEEGVGLRLLTTPWAIFCGAVGWGIGSGERDGGGESD